MGCGGSKEDLGPPANAPPASEFSSLVTQDQADEWLLIIATKESQFDRALDDQGKTYLLGRSSQAGCDIKVNDQSVSSKHAEVSFIDGKWCVKDVGSNAGTSVYYSEAEGATNFKAKQISGTDEPFPLPCACAIKMGNAWVTFLPKKLKYMKLCCFLAPEEEPTGTEGFDPAKNHKKDDEVFFKRDSYTHMIGRTKPFGGSVKHIRCGHPMVSGSHCEVRWMDVSSAGNWCIDDSESSNGTELMHKRVERCFPVALFPGAVISVGQTKKGRKECYEWVCKMVVG